MEQEIRFCTTSDGVRIAYATVGSGPAIVFPPPWVSHLELEWEEPPLRAFLEALARCHTVVRYDRHGCGLSDRERTDFTIEADTGPLEAVIDHLGIDRCALFGVSVGGPVIINYCLRHPERVSHLILYGSFARLPLDGAKLPQALAALIRAHWGIGSKVLADLFLPGTDARTAAWYARFQRASASPEMAAELLLSGLAYDVAVIARRVRTPAVVMHRVGDKVVPFEQGRELAALIPGARFVPLEGSIHRFYIDDPNLVLRQIATFLGERPQDVEVSSQTELQDEDGSPAVLVGDGLTSRETEVLLLIAAGLGNKEIAHRLGIRVATVERHAFNIYRKIGARNRVDAAAYAVRSGIALGR